MNPKSVEFFVASRHNQRQEAVSNLASNFGNGQDLLNAEKAQPTPLYRHPRPILRWLQQVLPITREKHRHVLAAAHRNMKRLMRKRSVIETAWGACWRSVSGLCFISPGRWSSAYSAFWTVLCLTKTSSTTKQRRRYM